MPVFWRWKTRPVPLMRLFPLGVPLSGLRERQSSRPPSSRSVTAPSPLAEVGVDADAPEPKVLAPEPDREGKAAGVPVEPVLGHGQLLGRGPHVQQVIAFSWSTRCWRIHHRPAQ